MSAPETKPHEDPRSTIVRLEDAPGRVLVTWADGHESAFPISWLRHDCYFPAHQNGVTQEGDQRRPAPADTITPERLALGADGGLEITWRPDGETTRHGAAWLRAHCPSRLERARRRRPMPGWPKGAPLEFSYDQVAADERLLLAFYRALLDYGLVILRGVPPVDGQVARVAALLGPLHETGYGRVVDVKTSSDLAIEANTPKRLEPHTDESYRYSPPGISLFHCLMAAPNGGGESLLVDGAAVADALRQAAPEAFELLSRQPLGFSDSGGGAHYFARGRVISLDLDGSVVGIRYSDRALVPLDLPVGEIEPVYRALGAWADLLYDPRFQFSYLMAPGDLHVFDNHRVLHGRTAFNVGHGTRHLQQCAVDRDEFHSNFRMLAKRLGAPDWRDELPGGALA